MADSEGVEVDALTTELDSTGGRSVDAVGPVTTSVGVGD